MEILKNKKGTDKIISVYWFAILFIVAGAVVYMVSIFYGAPYEVRNMEADIMINKIADCLSSDGKFKESIWKEGEFLLNNDSFFEVCNLNFNVEDTKGWREQGQYYVEINFYKFEDSNSDNFPLREYEITKGNINLKNFVKKDELDSSKLPFSSSKSLYVFDDEEKEFIVVIKVIIGKIDKNVQ